MIHNHVYHIYIYVDRWIICGWSNWFDKYLYKCIHVYMIHTLMCIILYITCNIQSRVQDFQNGGRNHNAIWCPFLWTLIIFVATISQHLHFWRWKIKLVTFSIIWGQSPIPLHSDCKTYTNDLLNNWHDATPVPKITCILCLIDVHAHQTQGMRYFMYY